MSGSHSPGSSPEGIRRAAAAERSELVAELQAAVVRAETIQAVTAALADVLTTAEVGDTIVSLAQGLFGATYATVMLLDTDGRKVRFLRVQPVPEAVARLMAEVPRSAASATSQVMATRQDLFHPDLDHYLSDYPHLEAATRALGVQALAHLPLVAGSRLLGLLSLSWREPQPFGPEDRRMMRTVAGQCSLAVQRAELSEQQSEITAMLQRAILPQELPHFADVHLAARYLPAEAGVEVGGDWYDAFPGPDGTLWLSVGDVGGHGVAAASTMGLLRNAVRAGVFAGLAPGAVLDMLDRLLAATGGDDLAATAVVLRFDPVSETLTWSSSGHMPPVFRPAEGGAFLLDETLGALLGVGLEGRSDRRRRLGPGDMIVLYTDGLVENRGEDLDVGLGRLVQAVDVPRDRPGAAGDVADAALASSLGGSQRQDDLCILVAIRPA